MAQEQPQQQQLREDQHYLPMRVNDPMMVVFWDVDQVRPIIICFALGAAFGAINLMMAVGLVYFLIAKKIKAKYPRGILMHIAWWHGILPLKKTRSMPDPMIREIYR